MSLDDVAARVQRRSRSTTRTSSGCAEPHKDAWQARGGLQPHISAVRCRGPSSMRIREFPHMNATVGDGELICTTTSNLGIAVDLDFEGLLVPVIRDADASACGPSPERSATSPTRARSREAVARRDPRRHVHDLEHWPCGTRAHRCRSSTSRRSRSSRRTAMKRRPVVVDCADGGESIAIHSVGNLALSWDHRAFDGAYAAAFLVQGQGHHRDAGLGKPSWRDRARCRPLHVRWLGRVALPRRARAAARRCSVRARRSPAAARAPARVHARASGPTSGTCSPAGRGRRRAGAHRPRRRRHLPRPGPAGRLPDPDLPGKRGGGHGRHRRLRVRGRAAAHRRARRPRPARRRTAAGLPGRVARRRHRRHRARSRRSACAVARPLDARLRAERRRPTWRCSATSFRAGSPTRA